MGVTISTDATETKNYSNQSAFTYKLSRGNTDLSDVLKDNSSINSLKLTSFKQTFGDDEDGKLYIVVTNFSSNSLRIFEDPKLNAHLMGSFMVNLTKPKDCKDGKKPVEILVDTVANDGAKLDSISVSVLKYDENTGIFSNYRFGEYGNCEFEVCLEAGL